MQQIHEERRKIIIVCMTTFFNNLYSEGLSKKRRQHQIFTSTYNKFLFEEISILDLSKVNNAVACQLYTI